MRAFPLLAASLLVLSLAAFLPSVRATTPSLPSYTEGSYHSWSVVLNATYGESALCTLVPSDAPPLTLSVSNNGTVYITGTGEEYWYVALSSNGTVLSCYQEGTYIPSYSEVGRDFQASAGGTYGVLFESVTFYNQSLAVFRSGVEVQNITLSNTYGGNHGQIVGISPSGQYLAFIEGAPLQVLIFGSTGKQPLSPVSCPSPEFWTGSQCATPSTGGGPSTCNPYYNYVCQSTTTTNTTSSSSTSSTAPPSNNGGAGGGLNFVQGPVFPTAIAGIGGVITLGLILRRRAEGAHPRSITGRGRQSWLDRHVRGLFD